MKLEDLKKLMETPMEKPQLQLVRDTFLPSTFTGLAYVNLKKLKTSDITQPEDGAWWIHIRRQKIDTLPFVRLLNIPLRIIEKYRNQRQGDSVFNAYRRSYPILLTRELGKVYGSDLTFHWARHNFGTHIILSLGVPIETVSRMMGYMPISTTQLYVQVTDKKVDEDMKALKASGFSSTTELCEKGSTARKGRKRPPRAI